MSEIVLFPLLFQYIDLATQKIALNIFLAYWILDSWPEIEPVPPALEVQS